MNGILNYFFLPNLPNMVYEIYLHKKFLPEIKIQNTNELKLGTTNGTFVAGDVIVGAASSASYTVDFIESAEFADKYDKGEEIETEADAIIDFSENNPFGTF